MKLSNHTSKLFLLTLLLIADLSLNAQNALLIPSTLSGKNINLNLQHSTKQFFTGQTTATMGANGNILGPTLILEQGDFVNFSVKNQLIFPYTKNRCANAYHSTSFFNGNQVVIRHTHG